MIRRLRFIFSLAPHVSFYWWSASFVPRDHQSEQKKLEAGAAENKKEGETRLTFRHPEKKLLFCFSCQGKSYCITTTKTSSASYDRKKEKEKWNKMHIMRKKRRRKWMTSSKVLKGKSISFRDDVGYILCRMLIQQFPSTMRWCFYGCWCYGSCWVEEDVSCLFGLLFLINFWFLTFISDTKIQDMRALFSYDFLGIHQVSVTRTHETSRDILSPDIQTGKMRSLEKSKMLIIIIIIMRSISGKQETQKKEKKKKKKSGDAAVWNQYESEDDGSHFWGKKDHGMLTHGIRLTITGDYDEGWKSNIFRPEKYVFWNITFSLLLFFTWYHVMRRSGWEERSVNSSQSNLKIILVFSHLLSSHVWPYFVNSSK